MVARVQGCSKATRARLYAAHLRVDRCAGALGATYVGAVREDELTHKRVFCFEHPGIVATRLMFAPTTQPWLHEL